MVMIIFILFVCLFVGGGGGGGGGGGRGGGGAPPPPRPPLAELDELKWKDGYAVTVVLAAEGYPASPRKGDVIPGPRH